VVFGFDDAVRGGAFAGDVAGGERSQSVGLNVVWKRCPCGLDVAVEDWGSEVGWR
jgi:hypothetical protein